MYIIDKNKDFYDHFSHIYGIDKSITFDRRGSTIINDLMIIDISEKYNTIRQNSVNHVLLEIGEIQYLIKLFDFIIEKKINDEVVSCSMELIRVFNDFKHYYDSPISIRGVDVRSVWGGIEKDWKYRNKYKGSFSEVITNIYKDERHVINLPILKDTQLTSFLDGHKIWIALQTYFSSLNNDKDVSIPMTDVEKAEIHGFDKKTSFRHPIK